MNFLKTQGTVHPHDCLNIAEILEQSVRPKAMARIEYAPSTLQNEPHKPRGTVQPHDCQNIAEIL